jgi:beta-mannosidase
MSVPGQTASKNLLTLVYPKELNLPNPELAISVRQTGDEFQVTLTAKAPALWAWLSLKNADASYSDNFNHVRPGSPLDITVKPEHPMTLAEFKDALQVRSLYDTYPHP